MRELRCKSSIDSWILNQLSNFKRSFVNFRKKLRDSVSLWFNNGKNFRKKLRDSVSSWSATTKLQGHCISPCVTMAKAISTWRKDLLRKSAIHQGAKTRIPETLGSIDNDNLWKRLRESIKALGSFEDPRTPKVLQSTHSRKRTVKMNNC